MTPLILASSRQNVLRDFFSRPTLLAFDFDGTLCPIVDDPRGARLSATTIRLLNRLAQCHPVALISGRSYSDLLRLTAKVQAAYRVGSHGIDWGQPSVQTRQAARLTKTWRRALIDVGLPPGMVLEDKEFSLSLHYRWVSRPVDLNRWQVQLRRRLGPDCRWVAGKFVWNLIPKQALHKGDALRLLWRKSGAAHVFFAGDDVTDEDAFRMRGGRRFLSVRVGRNRVTRASYALRDQSEMDLLLGEMVTILQR